jgi:NTE family protein
LFFTPFPYKGRRLFDGGLLNPVPVAPTARDATDMTIAVNLGGQPEQAAEPAPEEEQANDEQSMALHRRIAGFIEDLKGSLPRAPSADPGMIDIAQSSFDAMQSTLARNQLAAYCPDIEVVIPRDACKILEFDRAAELIELGYDTAEATIPSSRRHV